MARFPESPNLGRTVRTLQRQIVDLQNRTKRQKGARRVEDLPFAQFTASRTVGGTGQTLLQFDPDQLPSSWYIYDVSTIYPELFGFTAPSIPNTAIEPPEPGIFAVDSVMTDYSSDGVHQPSLVVLSVFTVTPPGLFLGTTQHASGIPIGPGCPLVAIFQPPDDSTTSTAEVQGVLTRILKTDDYHHEFGF